VNEHKLYFQLYLNKAGNFIIKCKTYLRQILFFNLGNAIKVVIYTTGEVVSYAEHQRKYKEERNF
jgi:hypothetical protein